MNTDPKKSAQPCGCDEGANHVCKECKRKQAQTFADVSGVLDVQTAAAIQTRLVALEGVGEILVEPRPEWAKDLYNQDNAYTVPEPLTYNPGRNVFPSSAQGRKEYPMFTGLLMYFPDALAAVAHVSKKGNDQHNPGEPLHWAREKSTDQMDTATRHMVDHGTGFTKDSDGGYHLAKAAWRVLAELQLTIEREREGL